jgi:SAM-dependent methyltransferase
MPTLPIDVAVNDTMTFLRKESAPCALLEVGCGKGQIARELMRAGYDVTAIDASDEAVEVTSALGVNALQADFLEYDGAAGPFDVIFFGRSLHHIHPLGKTVERARSMLKPGGKLLMEEFAAELIDTDAVVWTENSTRQLGSFHIDDDHGQEEDKSPDELLKHWKSHLFDKHNVATAEEMLGRLNETFKSVRTQRVAFMYRYVVDKIKPDPAAVPLAEQLLQTERALISAGKLIPIGLRIVASAN